tara:strand:+ start:3948 stop:4538 length:591 start_codon:yes stop_codon:yes gene_type:complete
MDLRIVFLASYEAILSITFGLLTIFLVNKILNITLLKTDTEDSLLSGNIAMGVFAGTLVLCNLILVQPSILPSISTLQTMLVGKESISIELLLVSFGFFLFFYLVTTLLSIGVLLSAVWIYLQATVNIDEIKEIRKNNIAVSVMLSLVVLGMTLFIQPSVSRLIASFVRYEVSVDDENSVVRDGEVAPPMEKINPE